MARTLLFQDWCYHTARVQKGRQEYPPSDVQGVDVLDFVAKELTEGRSFDKEENKRWVRVDKTISAGARSLLITASAGTYGETGEVIDRRNSSPVFKLEEDHAATAPTRMLVLVPDVGLHAFAFIERSTGRGAAGLDLVGQLHAIWREQNPGSTWVKPWIQDSEILFESGGLKGVQVRRYPGNARTVSAEVENLGTFEYAIRAKRGKFLGKKTLASIVKDAAKANELIGIEYEEGDKVFLDIKLEDRTVKVALEEGKLSKAQLVIENGLDDQEFIKCCTKEAEWVFDRVGLSYRPEWVSLWELRDALWLVLFLDIG
uniref:Uncharacterized protein n=1 Tax=Dulem virus 32 TaxID=3145750 RepID=A0AAU8B0L6_9CAUD